MTDQEGGREGENDEDTHVKVTMEVLLYLVVLFYVVTFALSVITAVTERKHND